MKNFSTLMLVMFMAMFWILRIVVAFAYELGMDFGGIQPFNQTMEIILLFVVFFSPPEISFSVPLYINIAPYPPGPGFPLHAPSVYNITFFIAPPYN